MDIFYFLGLSATGFVAGMVGSLLGLGGGIFVVPALVLLFHLPTLVAVGTSNVAVVATSTGSASSYVRSRMANIRLGLTLLISTTIAALASSYIASYVPTEVLRLLFAVLLLYTAANMLWGKRRSERGGENQASTISESSYLVATFYDPAAGKVEQYRPRNLRTGMGVSAIAGVVAGLLGVGGGIVQVPLMNLLMDVPLKAATSTSSFMIGVTATSSAFVRYAHGDVNPLIAAPIAIFVFLGARVGAWLTPRIPSARLRQVFAVAAVIIAALMVLNPAK